MQVELVAFTRPNPALTSEVVSGRSDLAAIPQGCGEFPEQLIEYAGRVCYRSTHRMGTAPEFISARVREGHEDIIEHVVVTVRIRHSVEPLRWRMLNRHCEVTDVGDSEWIVSGNTRVWLDFFRHGEALEAVPILKQIAPKVYSEFDVTTAEGLPVLPASIVDTRALLPAEEPPMRATLLGFTQPMLEDPELALHHGSASFFFEGISRTCTHQLVRHRLASFSQESQRYVDLSKGGWNAVIPRAVASNADAMAVMSQFWADGGGKVCPVTQTGHPQRRCSLPAPQCRRDTDHHDHELRGVESLPLVARSGQGRSVGNPRHGAANTRDAPCRRPPCLPGAVGRLSGAICRRTVGPDATSGDGRLERTLRSSTM